MRVEIDEELFDSPRINQLDLFRLFRLPGFGLHTIEVSPPSSGLLERWLLGLDARVQKECRLALELSFEALARFPGGARLRVSLTTQPRWQRPTELTLHDALRVLESPLRVLVENQRRDGAFLTAIGFLYRKRWLELQRAGVEVRHGGGVTEMSEQVKAYGPESIDRLRTFVVFDSDALAPGLASVQSQRLRKECEELKIPHHQLMRRAAENYLPPPALEAAAQRRSGAPRQQQLKTARAFGRLAPDQRHHFNMKTGFEGDEQQSRRGRATQLFANMVPKDRGALERGFGGDVGDLFADLDLLQEHWFFADGQEPEVRSLFEAILREV